MILHIDMDAFFASIEEAKNPHFRGRPIVVGADPQGGSGRGVVSTANYEARKYGVRSALPISRAWQLCPNAVFLPVNSSLYLRVSDAIMNIFKKYSSTVEQTSIDEAYLEVKSQLKNQKMRIKEAKHIAQNIKKDIFAAHQITCSIGISTNTLVAKVASDLQKPNGLTVVEPGKEEGFLAPLVIEKLPGVGPKAAKILHEMGVYKIEDLQAVDPKLLLDIFGKRGEWFYRAAHGEGEDTLSTEEVPSKSLGEDHTFERDTADTGIIINKLFDLIDGVCQNLEGRCFRTITVVVRYEGFITHTKSQTEQFPQSIDYLKKSALKLIWPFLHNSRKVRLVGFRVSNFK